MITQSFIEINFKFYGLLASHLSLDRILNESDVSSEDEFQDSETVDTESGIHIYEVDINNAPIMII